MHVAVVDPGVGGARAIVVLSAAGQYFIAPDNGLLGLIAQNCPQAIAYRVQSQGPDALTAPWLAPLSATFHGRDLMAPLAAELASERIRVEQLGPRHTLVPGRLLAPVRAADGSIRGQIAVIDRYGNALTTLSAAAIGAMRGVRLAPGGCALRLVRTYAEAEPGECVALINSASMLELAVSQGSAAAQLDVGPGQQVHVSEA